MEYSGYLTIVLYFNVLYNSVQYSTVHYRTVQYSTVQYCTVQYSTIQFSTVLYCSVLILQVRLITIVIAIFAGSWLPIQVGTSELSYICFAGNLALCLSLIFVRRQCQVEVQE